MDKHKTTGKVMLVAAALILHLSPFTPARAQFGDYGVRLSAGLATITDDLSTKSPIVGAGIGAYLDYTFSEQESILSEGFYLQSGLNLNRRGSNFRLVLEKDNSMSIREGYYHAYYLQLPVLAGLHFELPVRKAGHVMGVYLGPAASLGLFGRYRDRMVSPGLSDRNTNYDTDIDGSADDKAVFNHLRRLDVGIIAGLSYEYRNLSVTLSVDRGFVATSMENDVLRQINRTTSGDDGISVEVPNGYNTAWTLSVGYRLGSFSKK